ncbi:GNAT family N-acetyltransferase [Muricauda sp. 2012CJ35-5]|uniref:GNAT family N-acetyltransferase n=1 Tax=Flagellimonas spongiicola TaxID=2942208 RepID=A0ABT0PS95_9FLAO|nr:GNAT family N-acetyltransferase [Allomuricauda spongiicola]MCL6274240.1 GNAT family N-acetyltransferase [Allomuricauda spongiicola]
MEIQIKTFEQLSTTELYQLLELRSAVFVVEQECVYQDLDGKDQKAIHVLGIKNEKLVAYTRMFGPGDYFENSSIGRVVVAEDQRQFGYGKVIMEASLKDLERRFPETPIELSAQTYLLKFYNSLGFTEFGEEYLEDGIPHIRMKK